MSGPYSVAYEVETVARRCDQLTAERDQLRERLEKAHTNLSQLGVLLDESYSAVDNTRAMLVACRQERDRLALHLLNLATALSNVIPDDIRDICERSIGGAK